MSFSGMLIAPGRWSSAYSSAGSTSTSCAPACCSLTSVSRSISRGTDGSPPITTVRDVHPVQRPLQRCLFEGHDPAGNGVRIRPGARLTPVDEEVAVWTPLLVDVVAAAHQLFVGPEEHRAPGRRQSAVEAEDDRLSIRARRDSATTRSERTED